jgi:hypothetical protein
VLGLLVLALAPVAAGAQAERRAGGPIPAALLSRDALLHAPLSQLIDPVGQRRARAIADYQAEAFVGWAIAPIVAFLWLWRSGNAARLRDLLRRRLQARWLTRAAFGALLGALATLAQAPFAFAAHRIAASVGLTAESTGGWVLDELLRLVIVAACTALIVTVVLELVDRTRLWYLIFIALLYGFTLTVVALEPVVLTPLVVTYRPAPAAIVAQGDALARKLGASPVPIEIEATSRRTTLLSARAAGIGPFDRIVLGDALVERLTDEERGFVLARLYVLLREHVVLSLTLIGTTLFVLSAALAVLISDRIGFRRDDDALARLALVGTVLGLVVLVIFPGYNAIARGIQGRVDRIALTTTADPAAAIRLLIRRANEDLVVVCGRRSERWYFEGRPSLGTRIAAARGTADPCAP